MERLDKIWKGPVVWLTDKEHTGASLQLLCNEYKESQTRLVYWLWDPG